MRFQDDSEMIEPNEDGIVTVPPGRHKVRCWVCRGKLTACSFCGSRGYITVVASDSRINDTPLKGAAK